MFPSALVLFGAAGASDALDGYLAKRLALRSRFGAYLDPAADKLLMFIAFVVLTRLGATPLWLTVIVIGRDAAIVAGIALARLIALPIRMAPLAIGKASTAVQVGYVGFVLASLTLGLELPMVRSATEFVVAVVTIASWLAYGQLLFKALALSRRTA